MKTVSALHRCMPLLPLFLSCLALPGQTPTEQEPSAATVRPNTPFFVTVIAERADLIDSSLLAELLATSRYPDAVRKALPETLRPTHVTCGFMPGEDLRLDRTGKVCRFRLLFQRWEPAAKILQ